jgi:hypothetical protein
MSASSRTDPGQDRGQHHRHRRARYPRQPRRHQRRRPGQGHHHRRPDLGRRERQTDLHRAHQPAAGPRPGRDPEQQCQVTIKAGDTSAPYEHAAQGDDVYNDAAKSAWASSRLWTSTVAPSRTCSWAAREGGCHRHHRRSDRQADRDPSVTEGGEITYTITLTNKDGLPINNHGALTFTLSDGKTVITVPANGTTGTTTVTAPDNVYVGTNDPVVKSIATVEGADVGKFEN